MGYDNDIILLLLDDDLFWRGEDVERVESKSNRAQGRRLRGESDCKGAESGLGASIFPYCGKRIRNG